ncbi:DNA-directed RNA polymerase subunit omega [Candidatus Desantisbacteria bacterium CG2_30_40_21]|uniref:DNA-directed RNA polymerase subunit omega n=5 Tax=unclassified Candidatus Desantisiibacteriota TaxID=3106372 RepID=A0A2M7JB00_9BACT|nr:MAG: DNA-directed RNA polymerase subunit omega [Candidatus Desantisbacteria bacterium CG2_30_40_21]PIP42111.1 MAG: DNA-directed RNA polymerase subunit omega [Candidatus Desantisbacteria bacterium CG23_combo_of_CG06-09_8_20_14_all_40_23]PIX16600.1 MAG: DNA-directed RNA polymerase subunit omega [Candidatus Desantisbacteria bacterium CG_4_8_14_3_um_filter_40_12]PIY19992.1 MAG: DNA-directed RNA polymerase subunit omega [Candidatus Desantisbacteria bacterium CG_4_10_14_3_um_filter_40_18]PJB29978.
MRLDGILDKAPDRYKVAIVLSRRVLQLQQGSYPLVETKEKNPIAIALEEMAQGKIIVNMPVA